MIVSRASRPKAGRERIREVADRGVLVIGGAGFIGSNLVRRLLSHEPREIFVVDNLHSSDVRNVPDDPSVELILGSITDDKVLESLPRDVEYVFHLAGAHCGQAALLDPLAEHETTALASLKLFDRLKHFHDLEKVVYVASNHPIGANMEAGAKKDGGRLRRGIDPQLMPTHISKVVSELYAAFYHQQHGLPTAGLRLSTVYGPGEILGAGRWRGTQSTVWRAMVPSLIYRVLAGEDLAAQKHATDAVTYEFVDDVVSRLIALALDGEPGTIADHAEGSQTTTADLVEAIQRIASGDATEHAGHHGDGRAAPLSETGIQVAAGATAPTSLEQGLEQTFAWTMKNLALIRGCMQQHARFVDIPELDRARVPAGDYDAIMAAAMGLPAFRT